MSQNISLNEKMLTIHDHLKDVVKKGFDIMQEKNATIPGIKTLETLLQTMERFPNIEPIPNRYYKWREIEAYRFDGDELIPDIFEPEETKTLLSIGGEFYLFYDNYMCQSTNGFNFGKDISDLYIASAANMEEIYQENRYLWVRNNVVDIFNPSDMIYSMILSYQKNIICMDYMYAYKFNSTSYPLDANIVGMIEYHLDNIRYLIVATETGILFFDMDSIFAYAQNHTILPDTIEYPITRMLSGINLTQDNIILITTGSAQVYEAAVILEEDKPRLRLLQRWQFAEIPLWLHYEKATNILYGFNREYIMKGVLINQSEDIEPTKESLYCIATYAEKTPIDLFYGVIQHDNYLIFVTSYAVYIASSIQVTTENEYVINEVRIDLPSALGALAKIWLCNDILYLQGSAGQIYGLELPDVLGNPALASRAAYIANGMTGVISRGAIGQDIEAVTWKYRGELPEGYEYSYAELNQMGLILAKNTTEKSYQLYSVFDNGEPIALLCDSIPGITLENDELPSKLFLVSGMGKFYLFSYYIESNRAIVYYSGGDYQLWVPFELTQKEVMLQIFKSMEHVYASEENGFLIDAPNSDLGYRIAVLGPNLECLEEPYNPLRFATPIAGTSCGCYENQFFVLYANRMGAVFELQWDISIAGQYTCRVIDKKEATLPDPGNNSTIFLDGFFGIHTTDYSAFADIYYTPFFDYHQTFVKKSYLKNFMYDEVHLYRLSDSLLFIHIDTDKKISDPDHCATMLITYDGEHWEKYFPVDTGLPIRNEEELPAIQCSRNKNVAFIKNRCYTNGLSRNAYQTYFTHMMEFDLSKNQGQFHYHFEFSPRFVFFTAEYIDEIEGTMIGGYVSRELFTDKNGYATMFEGCIDENGNFQMQFINKNPNNTLVGQDLSLMFSNQASDSKFYKITLYAFA